MRDEEHPSQAWTDDGERLTDREFYYRMLAKAAGRDAEYSLEIRCPRDGHLRSEYQVPVWFMPYWVWRAYRWLVVRAVAVRVRLLRECPQCMFDRSVRGR